MASCAISTLNEHCIETRDHEIDFSTDDDNNGDWDELELVTNEDNLITIESKQQAQSIIESYRKECWQCTQCNTINNIRQCIKKHGSKCVGCQNECYIEFQTQTIEQTEWHSDNELYLLQMDELWQCESCLMINDKSNNNCTKCDKPSPMTIIRRKIKKFTKEEKTSYLIHGFIREHEYYLTMSNVPTVLFTLIQNFYVIDYLEAGWVIGNIKCMSIIKASNLRVGDKLDHKHSSGKFEVAEVKQCDTSGDNCKFKLEYEGRYYSSWSSWHDYNTDPLKFAEAGAVSARPGHRLKDKQVGDEVDINPIYNAVIKKHRGWKDGKIKELDGKSGQVKVEYKYNDTVYSCWTHLDNEDEIAEFGLMTGNTGMTISDLLRDDIEKQERERMDLGDQWQS